MAGDISLNTNAHKFAAQPSQIDQAAQLAKGLGLTENAQQLIKQVSSLLGNRNVNVTAPAAPGTSETGKPVGPTSIPTLDNPDDAKAKEADLEKLIAFLQLANEKQQTELAKGRIDTLKTSLEAEHANRKGKIEKSLSDMDEAAAAKKRSKIFGWLMTALAVVVAVVACVATGGVAVGAVIGAGVALAAQVLNETGVMDKIVKGLADELQKAGMSKAAAQIAAQIIMTVAIIAISLGSGAIGGAAAGASAAAQTANAAQQVAKTVNSAQQIAQTVKNALQIGSGVMGLITVADGAVGAYLNYNAGISQSELTETEKYIAIIQQRLEESEEELQELLEMIQNCIANIAQLLNSETDATQEIAMQIGQMA